MCATKRIVVKSRLHNPPVVPSPRERTRGRATAGEKLIRSLQPTQDLVKYYRKKLEEFDKQHFELLDRLDDYKAAADRSIEFEQELKRRNEEIAELQQATSDLQLFLFQEREQVLRLHAENDRLKLRELEDRKKISLLLGLCGTTEQDLTFFLQNPTLVPQAGKKVVVSEKTQDEQPPIIDPETLKLHIKSLQAQLDEQTRLSRDEVEMLVEEKRLMEQERKAEINRVSTQLDKTVGHLQVTQEMLHTAAKDFLNMRAEYQREERAWMVEKGSILHKMAALYGHCQHDENAMGDVISMVNTACVVNDAEALAEMNKKLREQIESLKEDLDEKIEIADAYKSQCSLMESEISAVREEAVKNRVHFREQVTKLSKHVSRLKDHHEDLERRRKLEAEGYLTDIRFLRKKVADLEKNVAQMLRAGVMPGSTDPVELTMLTALKRVLATTKHAQEGISSAKAQIYAAEEELRRGR